LIAVALQVSLQQGNWGRWISCRQCSCDGCIT